MPWGVPLPTLPPRAPLASMRVTPHGAYGFDRGGGVTHWGVDLQDRKSVV